MARKFKKNDIVLISKDDNIYMGVVMAVYKLCIEVQYDWYYGVEIRDFTKIYKIGKL